MSKLIIPGELPDLNTIIKVAKSHPMAYANLKKDNTDIVTWSAKSQKINKHEKIDLSITFYCKNRMKDKDNILVGLKFILDGLVKAGIITGDGWKQVGKFKDIDFKVDKLNPRVEVEIMESGGE